MTKTASKPFRISPCNYTLSFLAIILGTLSMISLSTGASITITSEDGSQLTITDTAQGAIVSSSPGKSITDPCASKRCGPNDLRHADDELNRVYQQLNKQLSKADEKVLRNQQRKWIRSRDIVCEIEYKGSDQEKWLGHVLSRDSRTACVIRVTDTRTSELKQQVRKLAGIRFSDTDEKFHDKTQQDWVQEYWKWVRKFSPEQSPSTDMTGGRCAQGQSGDVWFLTGSTGQNTIERVCDIPPDIALVVPVLNTLVQVNPGKSVECLELQAKLTTANKISKLHFTIDGIDHTEQALQNIITECFKLEDKRFGYSGDAVGGGHWAFIEALPPGKHTLSFGGVNSDGFRQDIHYNLTVSHSCKIPLQPGEADVIGVGRYRGLQSEPIQLGNSGHEVRSSKVVVNHPVKPVVLVLSAYDPTWWKVALTQGTVLKGVILAGYHTQAVTGIPGDIPLVKAVYEQKESCSYFYAFKADKQLDRARQRIQEITGQRLQKLITEPEGDTFILGDSNYNSAKLIVSSDYMIEDFPIKRGLPAGQKGIDLLVLEGKLRPATKDDIKIWVDAASEKYRDLNPNIKVDHHLNTYMTYVVLKPLTLPIGMYGAHSGKFLIPKGVPKPKDSGSHNSYYYMNSGTCSGPMCR